MPVAGAGTRPRRSASAVVGLALLPAPRAVLEATSTFSVTLWDPTDIERPEEGPALHRLAVRKSLTGDLEGETVGEGVACRMEAPEDGAGYLVMDRFAGRLAGREGTFVMQHMGVSEPGARPVSSGHVVPGSGTGELAGLRGTVEFGMPHRIVLRYELPS